MPLRNVLKPKPILISVAIMAILGVLVWQGIITNGNISPTLSHLNSTVATLDTAIIVLREGLEAILVLAALTANLVRSGEEYWKPISFGAGLSLFATVITWFVVVGIISLVGSTTSELNIQAGTGIVANVVLLIVMNWFFHKVYWTGWISLHNRKKRNAIELSKSQPESLTYKSLVILGLTSMYREGFEVVLFLQTIRIQVGSSVVLLGTSIGLALVLIVAILTFLAHRRLPYKKMLISTGLLLCVVLFVMTGETMQEIQLAGWIPTTYLGFQVPSWLSLWFSVYPTVQTLVAQFLAVMLVVGSYGMAQYLKVKNSLKRIVS